MNFSKSKKNLAKNLILIAMLSAVGTFSVVSGNISLPSYAAPLSSETALQNDNDDNNNRMEEVPINENLDSEEMHMMPLRATGERLNDTFNRFRSKLCTQRLEDMRTQASIDEGRRQVTAALDNLRCKRIMCKNARNCVNELTTGWHNEDYRRKLVENYAVQLLLGDNNRNQNRNQDYNIEYPNGYLASRPDDQTTLIDFYTNFCDEFCEMLNKYIHNEDTQWIRIADEEEELRNLSGVIQAIDDEKMRIGRIEGKLNELQQELNARKEARMQYLQQLINDENANAMHTN